MIHNKNKAFLIIICVGAFIFALSQSAKVFNLFSQKTPLEKISFSRAFYSNGGELLRLTLSKDEKYRLFVPFGQIPQNIKNAVLLYEDKFFYYHYGVNPLALLRGFLTTYVKKTRRVGASTITMQSARMIYKIDTSSISGKLKQILLAFWLEFRYTKNQIFEIYFNLAPYSYNIEGLGAASLIYFNTRAQEISVLHALTLSVIPQNPNKRNPSIKSGFAQMKTARGKLFKLWIKKYPQDKELETFFNMPLLVKTPAGLPFEIPHVINYLQTRTDKTEVFTTIDLNMQKMLEEEARAFLMRSKDKSLKNFSSVLLNYKNMEIEAAIGSADFFDESILGQVNGFNAKRLAGSTLKTFIYGLAAQEGIIHPATLLKDTKKNFGIYSPENSDRGFAGPVLAADALIRSRNIPAIELLIAVGYDEFVNLLKRGGVKGLKNGDYYASGLALGAFEVTPREVAGLYAALANGGVYHKPKLIKTDDSSGKQRLLTPEAAFLALHMLKDNQRPYGRIKGAVTNEYPVYFKTGTSSAFKDSWTAGVFEDYVLVVWIGNFNGEGNGNFLGRSAALPLFFNFVKTVEKVKPGFSPAPLSLDNLNIVEVDVCQVSGDLPGKFCPSTFKTYFIPGVSPIKLSDVHRRVLIDNATGLRACKYDPLTTRAEIYEFWPSEIENLFKEAGIIRKTVPKYVPNCTIEQIYSSGNPPEIIYPTKDVIYSFRESELNEKIIPLKAETDADARTVFWFLDDKFIGSASKNETLFITPKSGTFVVKVIDDLGRSSSGSLTMSIEAQN